jgi:hypothetical protein
MTTPSLTVEQAIGQLRLTDEQLRIWRKVTLVLGFRNVGKALSAIAPRKGAVKGIVEAQAADSEPPEEDNRALDGLLDEIVPDDGEEAEDSPKLAEVMAGNGLAYAEMVKPATGTWLIKSTISNFRLPSEMEVRNGMRSWSAKASGAFAVRAYAACPDHSNEYRAFTELVRDGCEKQVGSMVEDILKTCDACKESTRRNARLLAEELVSHMKGPGITYRGKGIWNKPIPRNKAGGLSCPIVGPKYDEYDEDCSRYQEMRDGLAAS